MTQLRIALEWFLNPDHLPLLAARDALRAEGVDISLIIPDDHYDGFAALADGEADLVVNEPLHLVERRSLRLEAHGCFFATEGGVLMRRQSLQKLAAGESVRIASPVAAATTNALCRDILAGWLRRSGHVGGETRIDIEQAGFAHVDNIEKGFDGAWLAFANVEGVDARLRGLDVVMCSTAEAGLPDFSALEIIARADADAGLRRSVLRLRACLDRVIPALKADPDAARQLWYEASGEAPSATGDAIVQDTLGRFRSPVAPQIELWRPMWTYLNDNGGDVVEESAFVAMFPRAND
jgi:hypothetical protein